MRYQAKGEGTDQSEAQEGSSSEKRVTYCPRSKKNVDQRLEVAFELLTFPNLGMNGECQHLRHMKVAKN